MTDLSQLLSPRQAIQHLKRYHLLNAGRAVQRLRSLVESAEMMRLYQHYFPADYAASEKHWMPDLDSSQAYGPRELELMELIGRHLFPIAHDWMDEAEERFYNIPIDSQAVNAEDVRELQPGLQTLIGLIGGAYSEVDWAALLASSPENQPPLTDLDTKRQYEVDWHQFEARCARLGRPLWKIGTALAVVGYSTGTVWLDYTDEMMSYGGFDFPWTVEAIDELTAEWQKAEKMLDDLDEVLDWLEARPGRIRRLVAVWNRCLRLKGDGDGAEE
jgi:hypothetical protein